MKIFWALLPPILMLVVSLSLFFFGFFLDNPFVMIGSYGLIWLFYFDLRGRWQDYEFLTEWWEKKACVAYYAADIRIMNLYGQSWCGRHVMIYTAPDPSGMKGHYYLQGYRWYHLLPDDFFKVVWRVNFWKNLARGHHG
jgi:hypothetical protein